MHDAFIKAIQEAETPEQLAFAQGVYADWLEEQGDERCELIRLSVRVRGVSAALVPSEEVRQLCQGVYESPLWNSSGLITKVWAFACRFPSINVGYTCWSEPEYKAHLQNLTFLRDDWVRKFESAIAETVM